MGRFRSRNFGLAVAILSLLGIVGCSSYAKSGTPLFAGHVNLTPGVNTSLVLGGTIAFVASVQAGSGTNLNVPITYSSSDTSILNLAPNGVACAGHWDINFTQCTPGATGPVTVTASAQGASSVPTFVFVHPAIDNITVTGVLLNGLPVQEPCLSQTQTMTVEAHAFSQGTDITSSVGPFTWSASNNSVVTLTPIVNSAYNFPTNQATATAAAPGMAQIFATASGVTSHTFQQPQYSNSQGTTSPLIDFFSTCPIQSISLEVGAVGTGQTSFVTAKGTSENVVATIFDVMGKSSLPNTNGQVILTKVPLTWTSSHPGAISAAANCTQSCAIATPSPGSGTVTASCSPPTCNVGFPIIPASLSTSTQIDACTQFFQATSPQSFSCQLLIPMPVYASTAVAGVATGAPGAAAVFATSMGCANQPPASCSDSSYFFSTAKASTGPENAFPTPPNSFIYDLTGDKVYMGSNFGAEVITPAQFNTANNPFTLLGTVTGRALAVSTSGLTGVFSDTVHTPNQVYVVNTANATSPAAIALAIPGATAAAFSPDELKTFIVGGTAGNSLYVYSTLQALQAPIALSGPANAVAFSPNGAFALIAESAAPPNVTAYSTCNNQVAATVTLPANPILMKVLPNVHMDGQDSYGNSIPDGVHVLVLDSTGLDIITATIAAPAPGNLCPQSMTFVSGDPLRPAQRVELGQGTVPAGTYQNFFASADASLLYIANGSTSSILTYNFVVGSVTGGIELLNNATPVMADMSLDAGTILIAGSDGMVHEVSTSLGGSDLVQLPFPNIPDYLNPFCTIYPTTGVCTLDVALTKP
jgi:hypothetical protein